MRRGRILIAEDGEEWLNPLADACRADGYDVLVATNGRDALTQAQNNHRSPNGGWDETWFSPMLVEQNPG